MDKIVGKRVEIHWCTAESGADEDMWHDYTILEYAIDPNGNPWLLLQGEDADDGGRYVGKDFWVELSSIDTIGDK